MQVLIVLTAMRFRKNGSTHILARHEVALPVFLSGLNMDSWRISHTTPRALVPFSGASGLSPLVGLGRLATRTAHTFLQKTPLCPRGCALVRYGSQTPRPHRSHHAKKVSSSLYLPLLPCDQLLARLFRVRISLYSTCAGYAWIV